MNKKETKESLLPTIKKLMKDLIKDIFKDFKTK